MEQHTIELLAPAGTMESLKAAIYYGADAIYLAGSHFGARAYAGNFSDEELKEAIDLAHLYGRKVFVTINTLIKETEFKEAVAFLDMIYYDGADAVIVSDLGILALSRNYPDMEFHASTQLNTLTVNEAIKLKALGAKRIILGREAPLSTVQAIKEATGLPVEVFSYGALCVAYSGNCLASSLLGNRSGNRGRCAQICRKEMTFKSETVAQKGYLLSMKDLDTLDYTDELVQAGVDSLKIEGRMKKSSYVANVVEETRARLNHQLLEDHHLDITFSRPKTKGYILGEDRANIVSITNNKHMGRKVGDILCRDRNNVLIKVLDNFGINDGLRLINNHQEDAIIVSDMYKVANKERTLVKEAYKNDIISLKAHDIFMDGQVYLTSSYKIDEGYKTHYEPLSLKLDIALELSEHEHILSLKARYLNKEFTATTSQYEYAAKPQRDRIKSSLFKTNDTPFNVKDYQDKTAKDIFMPVKDWNELRRHALTGLYQELIRIDRRPIEDHPLKVNKLDEAQSNHQIYVSVHTTEQYEALKGLLKDHPNYIINIESDNPAICLEDKKMGFVAPRVPQVYTPSLDNAIVASNLDSNSVALTGYLNIGNNETLRALAYLGYKRMGASVELSKEEIEALDSSLSHIVIDVYGHIDAMITRYCLMRALGPCSKCHESSTLTIDDQIFPMIRMDDKSQDCYTRILSPEPISYYDSINELRDKGYAIRLNFTIESGIEVKTICEAYFKKWFNNENTLLKIKNTSFHFKEAML